METDPNKKKQGPGNKQYGPKDERNESSGEDDLTRTSEPAKGWNEESQNQVVNDQEQNRAVNPMDQDYKENN